MTARYCAQRLLLLPGLFALLIAMKAYAGSDRILFNFQTVTNLTAWQVVNDTVMGGVSTSSFRLTNGVARFRGEVSLDNNGGFASVRSLPARLNVAGCEAFVIRVRGDGRRYKFTARTESDLDSAVYQTTFAAQKGKWEEHRLPFKDFVPTFRGRVLADRPPLEGERITSVGFLISDKQEGPFKLELAWVKVVGAIDPPSGDQERSERTDGSR